MLARSWLNTLCAFSVESHNENVVKELREFVHWPEGEKAGDIQSDPSWKYLRDYRYFVDNDP